MKKWLSISAIFFMTALLSMNVVAQEGKTTAALGEWITISESAGADANSEEIEKLFAYIKQKAADGELETEEDILAAIEEGENEFGVVLSEEEVQKITGTINKLSSMGLDSEYLISQAEKLYDKYGEDIVNHADEAISEAVSGAVNNAAKGFFESIKDSVKEFWNNLFD